MEARHPREEPAEGFLVEPSQRITYLVPGLGPGGSMEGVTEQIYAADTCNKQR